MIFPELTSLPYGHPWREQIQYFDCIPSTNDLAKQLAQGGAPHGTVLLADSQSAGRGRMGRSFLSPSGHGIYMSVLLRQGCKPEELMHLTCATAVALCDAVEQSCGIRPGIKWTNDLVCHERKLAGILTELCLDPATGLVDYAIIGIGINCTQGSEDFPPELQTIASSLAAVTGKYIDRERVTSAVLEHLFQMDARLHSQKDAILAQYRADCITLGKDISLLRGNSVQYGHALDITDDGALLVRFPDGKLDAVNSGEVSIRGMYGYVEK